MRLFHIRPLQDADRPWVTATLREQWGDTLIVSRGRLHQGDTLPGFVAIKDGEPVGLITYRMDPGNCEIVSLNSLIERIGIGSALIDAVKATVKGSGARLWLITTNDNMYALRFYQKRGFRLVAIYANAMEEARRLKPAIALTGYDGIPIRDEIELDAEPVQLLTV